MRHRDDDSTASKAAFGCGAVYFQRPRKKRELGRSGATRAPLDERAVAKVRRALRGERRQRAQLQADERRRRRDATAPTAAETTASAPRPARVGAGGVVLL